MGAKPPRLDSDETALAVSQLSREPFQDVLGHLVEVMPGREAVRQLARQSPDRWVDVLTTLAQLGGQVTRIR